jgi:hypothetical protein
MAIEIFAETLNGFNSIWNFDFGWSELFGGQGVSWFFVNLSLTFDAANPRKPTYTFK